MSCLTKSPPFRLPHEEALRAKVINMILRWKLRCVIGSKQSFYFFVSKTSNKVSGGDMYSLLDEHLWKVMNMGVIHRHSKLSNAMKYICSLTLHPQVSQQVNYAKAIYEEGQFTVIWNADGMLEVWTFCKFPWFCDIQLCIRLVLFTVHLHVLILCLHMRE
jgi:hypothetical protein